MPDLEMPPALVQASKAATVRTIMRNAAALVPLQLGQSRTLEDMPPRHLGLLVLGFLMEGKHQERDIPDNARNVAPLRLIELLHRLGGGVPVNVALRSHSGQMFVLSLREDGDERALVPLVSRLHPLPPADEPTTFSLRRFGWRQSLELVRAGTRNPEDRMVDPESLGRSLRPLVHEMAGLVEPLAMVRMLLCITTRMQQSLRERSSIKMTARHVQIGDDPIGDLALEFGFCDLDGCEVSDHDRVMAAAG